MAKIHVAPDGTETVLKPGLPYKSLEGKDIEGFVSNYYEGPDIAKVEEVARAFAQTFRDMGWWGVFVVTVIDDDDLKTVIGYGVEAIRTPGRHRAFKNACRRAREGK